MARPSRPAPPRSARDSALGVTSRANDNGDGPEFWGPLLAANVNAVTSSVRYGPAVQDFLAYVRECGEDLYDKDDADYWLAHYIHLEYAKGPTARGTRKGHCRNVVYGLEHFYPGFKPLTVARRCIAGWDRLVPPVPYAPMHLDLAFALAAVLCVLCCYGVAIALLVSFDAWLRISEVSALTPGDIVDNRHQADPVGRGVAVYIASAKTGRRQAVLIDSLEIAELLVAWRDAHRAQGLGDNVPIFPSPAQLRRGLAQALAGVGLADGNDRGLQFFVAFVPPRRRFACVFAREAHVRYIVTGTMESGGVRPPLRAVGAPAAYRQSAAPSRDAAGAAGPVIGARGAVEAGSRRPLGLVIAGDDRTYCGVRSTPG